MVIFTQEHRRHLSEALQGKKRPLFSKEWRENMSKSGLGKKRTPEQKIKYSLSKLGKKNPLWKGDEVGLKALHEWVKRYKPKPKVCENCHKKGWIDLANISQEYKRDLTDWEWLCRKCHMIKDGRIDARDEKGRFTSYMSKV